MVSSPRVGERGKRESVVSRSIIFFLTLILLTDDEGEGNRPSRSLREMRKFTHTMLFCWEEYALSLRSQRS